MRTSFFLVIVPSLILGMVSCSNDTGELISGTEPLGDFTLHATYKGVTYEVPGMLDKDGNPVYLNEEFNELYKNEISTNPTLVTVVMDGNKVEYHESLSDVLDVNNIHLLEQAKIPEISSINTKTTSGQSGRVIVWDDSNYSDRSLTFDIKYDDWWAIPQLRDYNNFNDKISSLKIWSYIDSSASIQDKFGCYYPGSSLRITFVGYENDNYSGRVLLCLCSPGGEHFDNRLGNIGWNDKITALRVLITDLYSDTSRQYFSNELGYHYHGSLNSGVHGTLGYPSISPYSQH